MNTQIIIKEAISLPVEERAMVVGTLLRSLNQPKSGIDKKWADVAIKRLAELKEGKKKGIPADKVFEKIWARLEK